MMNRLIELSLLWCTFFGALTIACDDDRAAVGPGTGGVRGTVTQVRSGDPAAGVGIVLIDPLSISPLSSMSATNAQGRFEIGGVPPGEYAVFVYHDSLVVFSRPDPLVRVEARAATTYDMTVIDSELWNGAGYRIEGTVLNARTGNAVARAFVEPWAWALGADDVEAPFFGVTVPDWAVTDDLGRFSITSSTYTDETGMEIGLFPITVFRQGYEPFTLVGPGPDSGRPGLDPPLPLPPDSVLTVTVQLVPLDAAPPGALRGRVIQRGPGTPVANARVALSIAYAAEPETLRSRDPLGVPVQGKVGVTNAEGEFRIDGLSRGVYTITAAYLEGDGYASPFDVDAPEVTIAVGDTAAVDAGDVLVVRSLRPIDPADGAIANTTTPELRWEAFPSDMGYEVVGYELQYNTGYPLDCPAGRPRACQVGPLPEPRWTVPPDSAFAPGDHVRWIISALGVVGSERDTVELATFERAATFRVAP